MHNAQEHFKNRQWMTDTSHLPAPKQYHAQASHAIMQLHTQCNSSLLGWPDAVHVFALPGTDPFEAACFAMCCTDLAGHSLGLP